MWLLIDATYTHQRVVVPGEFNTIDAATAAAVNYIKLPDNRHRKVYIMRLDRVLFGDLQI